MKDLRRALVHPKRKSGSPSDKPKVRARDRIKAENKRAHCLETATTIQQLMHCLNVRPEDWDVVIAADGSGQTFDAPGGWGSVVVRRDMLPVLCCGGASHLSSQAAELFAILHPLLYITSERIGVKLNGCRVVIISDSKNTCNGLEVEDPLWVKQYSGAHLPLWLSLHALKRHGLTYVVRHVPRDRAFLQKACHDLANIARKSQAGVRDKLGWSDEQLAAF